MAVFLKSFGMFTRSIPKGQIKNPNKYFYVYYLLFFFLTFCAEGTEPAQFAEALPLGMRCGLDVKTFSMTAAILVLSAFVPELATVTYTHVMLLHHSFLFN